MDAEDFEEIGGRCDMRFNCDFCGDVDCDETIDHYVRMFRVGDNDMCENCLNDVLAKSVDSLVASLSK